jgi:hypothetical protein
MKSKGVMLHCAGNICRSAARVQHEPAMWGPTRVPSAQLAHAWQLQLLQLWQALVHLCSIPDHTLHICTPKHASGG